MYVDWPLSLSVSERDDKLDYMYVSKIFLEFSCLYIVCVFECMCVGVRVWGGGAFVYISKSEPYLYRLLPLRTSVTCL